MDSKNLNIVSAVGIPVDSDRLYMRRALQLARGGEGRVSPNPMVGAVIVARGRIIGEGFHRTFGGPHAEVNAVRSVREADRKLLKESTIYVTLEPCSHYGKTPPCAKLIIDTGIPNVVVGAPDPNPLVAGRGIRMLREAGVSVTEGVLLEECLEINRRFMTAQTHSRPWILLKWAQSADGFMAALDADGKPVPVKFSTPMSSVWMHRQRALVDAIMVGTTTLLTDKPRLDVRLWAGKNPRRIECPHSADLHALMSHIRSEGITSIMIEGGPTLLKSFIREGLYDEIRVETAPFSIGEGLRSPELPPNLSSASCSVCRENVIRVFRR